MKHYDRDESSEHDEYFRFTGRARLSRDMHILEGYVRGIAADSKIQDIELKRLMQWISGHKEFADRHPFNEVIPKIQRIISDGIADEEERADLLWLSSKFTTEDEYYDDVTSDLQRLQGMLAGILSDGKITEGEIGGLESWIKDRSYLRGCWPFDYLYGIIEHVMRDGRIDAQEHEALLQLFGEFFANGERKAVGALEAGATVSGVCANCPEIAFPSHGFCFTGASERGSKRELEVVVIQRGGVFHKGIREDTNYLVVGSRGNPCWAFACYGRKIEEALHRRCNGQRIDVVHERDFWQVADRVSISPNCSTSTQTSLYLSDRRKKQAANLKRQEQIERSSSIQSDLFAGKTLVVTGTLAKYKRDEIEALIVKHGGHAASSVSKNTDYLVAGEKAGSKLEKATQLGVRIIDEAEFDRLIGNG